MAQFANIPEDVRERLEMLIEEASEVIFIGTKILRHGFDSFHPDNPFYLNGDMLEDELVDLLTLVDQMVANKDINNDPRTVDFNASWKRKLKYTHHQSTENVA